MSRAPFESEPGELLRRLAQEPVPSSPEDASPARRDRLVRSMKDAVERSAESAEKARRFRRGQSRCRRPALRRVLGHDASLSVLDQIERVFLGSCRGFSRRRRSRSFAAGAGFLGWLQRTLLGLGCVDGGHRLARGCRRCKDQTCCPVPKTPTSPTD